MAADNNYTDLDSPFKGGDELAFFFGAYLRLERGNTRIENADLEKELLPSEQARWMLIYANGHNTI